MYKVQIIANRHGTKKASKAERVRDAGCGGVGCESVTLRIELRLYGRW